MGKLDAEKRIRIHMLIKPLIYYDKIYLYSKNLGQEKIYIFIRNILKDRRSE